MDQTPCTSLFVVGIDISKHQLDMHVLPTGQRRSVKYDAEGLQTLVAEIQRLAPRLVVLEATGGLERRVAAELVQAGCAVAVVNPRQVRDFARGIGQLAKTDRLDAEVLARFGQLVQPRPLEKHPEKLALMHELVTRRGQLIDLRTAELNRQHQAGAKAAAQSIRQVLAMLDKQLQRIDAQIAKLVESHDDWRRKAQVLESFRGVGKTSSHALIASLPELGELNRKQIGALVGVAPLNCDSGKRQGKAAIRGGRARVRSTLYMVALTGIRSNPAIRQFAQRLKNQGKPFKVVITACMRKILTILNYMLKNNTEWQPNYQPQPT